MTTDRPSIPFDEVTDEQGSHLSRFECRRWFGLVLHRRGMSVLEGYADGGYARRAAARAWNRGLEVKP